MLGSLTNASTTAFRASRFRVSNAVETPERPNPASGLGVARTDLLGFRAPFIEPADNGMTAVQRKGLLYDSSIEEIVRPGAGADGDGFRWPYTLDRGLPENKPPIGSHPGPRST